MTDTEPGSIELDRSGSEPVVRLGPVPAAFTLDQLRMYGEYLITVATEAEHANGEPDVDELVAMIDSSQARWMPYHDGVRVLAREILAAGYKRDRPREPAEHAGPSPAGVRLRQERERLGWSLREAERHSGVPNAHISQIETGVIQRPELATVAPLAAAYGLSLNDLAGRTGSPVADDDEDRPPWEA